MLPCVLHVYLSTEFLMNGNSPVVKINLDEEWYVKHTLVLLSPNVGSQTSPD